MGSQDIIARPDEALARLNARGTTQTGMRLYNERLVLSLIRTHGSISKAEIARLTGLSAQTVSVIVRQLESDDLLIKGDAIKGKVGQPLQPFSLNPDGAFSIGLKVGRRSGDLLLLDLNGKVRDSVHQPYHFPDPEEFLDFAKSGIEHMVGKLPPHLRKRISGLGIAAPFEIWKWEEEAGAPHHVMEAWKQFDLTAAMAKICDWPVLYCNDATSACAAELFFGLGQQHRNYAYFYIGYFVGGGLVINGNLFQGDKGNAAAFGSIPVPRASGGSEQLIRSASLYLLENELRNDGRDPAIIWQKDFIWDNVGPALDRWIAQAARSLAIAATGLAATLECTAVIIDGAIPGDVREKLVQAMRKASVKINQDGVLPYSVEPGTIGFDARALGAASLPLFANFMIDRDVLFKEVRNYA